MGQKLKKFLPGVILALRLSAHRRFHLLHQLLNRVCLILLLTSADVIAADSWVVPERSLPIPAGASSRLQADIAGAGQPNLSGRMYVPQSEPEWRELIAARQNSRAFNLDELARTLNVTIRRDEIAGVAVHRVTPGRIPEQNVARLFVYLHGGAYVFGAGDASVGEGALIASRTGLPVISVDYRMPPDHPSPAAVKDVTAVYRELLKSAEPGAIAMGGTSAGGGLTLASVQHFRSQGLPVPGALYLGTPWADLTKTSDTLYTNEGVDRRLVTYDGLLRACALLYAAGQDLKKPLISPVYGEYDGLPPTYLVSGTRDMLLSDTVRVHRKLRTAGVEADLNVYEGMSHAEYTFLLNTPESRQTYAELSRFLDNRLSTPGSGTALKPSEK